MSLQDDIDFFDDMTDTQLGGHLGGILNAARLVAKGVPVVLVSRLSREYAITDDLIDADAWLIDLPKVVVKKTEG